MAAKIKYEVGYPIDLPWYPSISNESPSSFCTQFIELLTQCIVNSNPNNLLC